MAEINIAKVHKNIKECFDGLNLKYSLTDRVRMDIWIRKWAYCYSQNEISSVNSWEHDIAITLFDKYLWDFHQVLDFVHRRPHSRAVLQMSNLDKNKIYEEDRRIEDLDVSRY